MNMTSTRDLLFELGTEELPPTSLLSLSTALARNVEQGLEQAGLAYGTMQPYATPRRLALLITDLAGSQPDKVIEKRGPALKAAYTDDGIPTKAAEGFARGCGTTVDQLGTMSTEKGEWLSFKQEAKGAKTTALMPGILEKALLALPIPKKMCWGASPVEFVRPVHWLVLIYGSDVIETELLGLSSGRSTFGHRFHHPDTIELSRPDQYLRKLREEGKVLADFSERQSKLHRQALGAAESVGGSALIEAELLDEVTALVEWPVAVAGSFDERFLALPSEVLITTMQSHQKYFPVEDGSGKLLPYFITISNVDSSNPDAVRQGNERVIRPRLTDAEFFWNQDRKTTLESRAVSLSNIVFQNRLGTMADKAHRVERVAEQIADELQADAALAKHAAILAKADLLTEMVGEFPTLQGIMGRHYALADGEPPEVAAAIEEHYLPKQSGGELPGTPTGQILALADKIDTLTGIFSIGLIPSGDKDPYALRRAALGVLRILIEQELDLELPVLLDFSLHQYGHEHSHDDTKLAVYTFILERLKGYCLDRGYSPAQFDAVCAVQPPRPLDFELRLKAVKQFSAFPEAESLAAANKRIRNILRKSGTDETALEVDAAHLAEPAEQKLFAESSGAAEAIEPLVEARDYTAALRRLAALRDAVDAFFDQVLVMDEDPARRQNRLALLARLEAIFLQIADISKLQL
jgi:glycyl-tRNA synthetase beta chain